MFRLHSGASCTTVRRVRLYGKRETGRDPSEYPASWAGKHRWGPENALCPLLRKYGTPGPKPERACEALPREA